MRATMSGHYPQRLNELIERAHNFLVQLSVSQLIHKLKTNSSKPGAIK